MPKVTLQDFIQEASATTGFQNIIFVDEPLLFTDSLAKPYLSIFGDSIPDRENVLAVYKALGARALRKAIAKHVKQVTSIDEIYGKGTNKSGLIYYADNLENAIHFVALPKYARITPKNYQEVRFFPVKNLPTHHKELMNFARRIANVPSTSLVLDFFSPNPSEVAWLLDVRTMDLLAVFKKGEIGITANMASMLLRLRG